MTEYKIEDESGKTVLTGEFNNHLEALEELPASGTFTVFRRCWIDNRTWIRVSSFDIERG